MERGAGSARSPRRARAGRTARPPLPEPLRRELAAVVVAALAALLGGALAGAPMGPAGQGARLALRALFGLVAWAAPLALAAVAAALLRSAPPPSGRSRAAGAALLVADLAGWAAFARPAGWEAALRGEAAGGLLGTALRAGLAAAVGRFGALVLLAALGLAGLLLLSASPLTLWMARVTRPLKALLGPVREALEDFLFEEEAAGGGEEGGARAEGPDGPGRGARARAG
ncbi:MAG: DNA translocase FtsK 4TM domain-containing protein, partial [Clostridia bacterium]|nr:DNA translocase FtsK 4TM domain-containing protein [Clostridia bacterium]